MLGDLTSAIMPMFLIWRLSRSVVERCLISFLMAMGLFATGAGVRKIICAYTYDRNSHDALREMMPEFLWCRVEEVVLVVACSAPLLKAPVGNMLQKLGFPNFRDQTRDLQSFHSSEFEVPQEGYREEKVNDEEKGQNGSSTSSTTIGEIEGR